MRIKVSEATPIQLDWLVAMCQYNDGRTIYILAGIVLVHTAPQSGIHFRFSPSTDWLQGGLIIEQEGINTCIQHDEPCFKIPSTCRWYAQMDCRVHTAYGPTPLIAAMRCFVTSKLDNEVEVPDELCILPS